MLTRETPFSIGTLTLRVAFGSLMIVHALQSAAAFNELKETFTDPLGIGHQVSLILTVSAEIGFSLLLLLGLGTRLAASALTFMMLIAVFVVHAEHEWNEKELPAIYLCVYLSLILTGPGRFSVDRLISIKK